MGRNSCSLVQGMTENFETIQAPRGAHEEHVSTAPNLEAVQRKHGLFYQRPPPPLRRREQTMGQQEPPTRGRHHQYRSYTAEKALRGVKGKSETERHRYQVEQHKAEHPHGESYKSVSRKYRKNFKDV